MVAALAVSSGAERQSLEGPGLHGVISVLMGVNVLSKLKEAMFGKLDGLARNHGSWAKHSGYAILGREDVDPECHDINYIMNEDTWDMAV